MKKHFRTFIATLVVVFSTFTLISGTQNIDEKNNKKYAEKWQKVDSLERKGLYRMALKEVDLIFDQATKEKAHNQVIKSVLFELKYNSYLEEDDYVLGIYRLEELVANAPSPSKEIFHSILAEVYWGYYSANSWKFSGRTTVTEMELKDVRTWDLKRIAEKVRWHYTASLFNAEITQKKPVDEFSEIINRSSEKNTIRPTLYDFLGHRALDFFNSTTFNVPGPAETFVVDDENYFASNSSFLKMNAATQDSLNTRFMGARVLHMLTRFHMTRGDKKPLFYIELERLSFARSHSTLSNKEDLFYKGLQRLANIYEGEPFAAVAWYQMAAFHSGLGDQYHHLTNASKKEEKKKAYEICKQTIANYPNSYGAGQCESLLSYLLDKEMRTNAEEVIVPGKKNKFLLSYRNLSKAYMKIVPFSYKKIESDRYYGDKLVNELAKRNGVYNTAVNLTDPKDYNQHSTEILLPELEPGFYYVVLSSAEDFKGKEEGFTYYPIWVTDITFQNRENNNKHELLVSDRTTGNPLEAAKVTVSRRKYDYKSGSYKRIKLGTYTTDKKGLIAFEKKNDYSSFNVEIEYEGQVYAPGRELYHHYYDDVESHYSTQFFTDRKLYRPGQTIYFKGICLSHQGKERELLKNYSTQVRLIDVNHQEVERIQVTTNQFGSFEGKFTAPYGVLTGQMRIENGMGSTYFRVEEYKRPKFNVEMQPVTGEFNVNDSISVTGVAQAFAGNKIDGAAVKYRVVRSTQFTNWYWWRWYPPMEPKEISNGTLTTDENGEFNVVFKALPDLESNPENLPLFTYTIYADVTDINGETHSTSTMVTVGYQSLRLGHNWREDMNNQDDFVLKVSTKNLNGQSIEASGSVKIERLKTPNQPFYQRLWQQPDIQGWTQEEFKKIFPDEAYENEHDYHNWEVAAAVAEASFNTAKTDSVLFEDYAKWKPGVYRYQAKATDKNGVEVIDTYYFTLFNPKAKQAPTNYPLWVKSLKTSAEPGETVEMLIGTTEKDVLVNYDLEANGKIIKSETLNLSNEQKNIKFEVIEAWRGNFTVHFTAIRKNRHFSQDVHVVVPYTNKALDLNFATFRNKLLPGEAEEWVLTIKNKYGEKEQAELLATLYDASLDELYMPNDFYLNIYRTYYGRKRWAAPSGFQSTSANNVHYRWNTHVNMPYRYFATLNYWGWQPHYYPRILYSFNAVAGVKKSRSGAFEMDEIVESEEIMDDAEGFGNGAGFDTDLKDKESREDNKRLEDGKNESTVSEAAADGNNPDMGDVKARTNFNETAFFYPQLTTNEKGEVQVKFTIPESLTKWRFLGLAHTKDLKIGTITEEVITQKDLMVVPNAPRFLREGDQITISTKISNVSEEDLYGKVQLNLYDPFTDKPIESDFELENVLVDFTAEKGKSTTASWTIKVPYTHSAVKYKIVAKAGNFSDGEENVLPVLSNRMLVTESLPLPIRGEETKTFSFDKLKNSGSSSTLRHHRYTLEFTSNPAWYAIQAMPYMMEYPHECAEQTFTRYYSNAIATHIMNSNPKIRKVIEDWGENSPEAFLSNLQKNQELKAVILEETPWVLDAQNEEASKRNLAVLLDMERMSRELDKALGKTIKTQVSSGGWPWFPGMRESRYITQHIVTGMGHLDHLGIKDVRENHKVWKMIKKAVGFLDKEIVRDFEYAQRDHDYLINRHIGYSQIQYLYARSYFPKIKMNKATQEAVEYYKNQSEMFWLDFNIYAEGMIALAADRFGKSTKDKKMTNLANDIVKSLKDRSIQHEEFGMYWKDLQVGYYWYQAPIETQALMIEVFDEVTNDQKSVEELKIWLLKQKQTTNWKTTKQTTEAVYALLLKGTDLLASDDLVEITLGGKAITYSQNPDENDPYQVKAQAGTGYFKTAWKEKDVKPKMGDITVSKSSTGVAWGAAYWQYFEDLDKITFAETNLKLKKDLFLVEVTNRGEELKPVNDKNELKIGQKVRVRIELRTDRNMEYVHLKDMRASGFEPIDVLSSYRYQDGLGYYQSTKDVATHFFFDYIRKGTYVFEYDLRVQHKGDFSNGLATIQCMYAPEFTSHSDGIRITVK